LSVTCAALIQLSQAFDPNESFAILASSFSHNHKKEAIADLKMIHNCHSTLIS